MWSQFKVTGPVEKTIDSETVKTIGCCIVAVEDWTYEDMDSFLRWYREEYGRNPNHLPDALEDEGYDYIRIDNFYVMQSLEVLDDGAE